MQNNIENQKKELNEMLDKFYEITKVCVNNSQYDFHLASLEKGTIVLTIETMLIVNGYYSSLRYYREKFNVKTHQMAQDLLDIFERYDITWASLYKYLDVMENVLKNESGDFKCIDDYEEYNLEEIYNQIYDYMWD